MRVHILRSFGLFSVQCEPISGLGFRRGSYKCVCQTGYYHPDTSSPNKYFNGTVLEEEYAKILEVTALCKSCLGEAELRRHFALPNCVSWSQASIEKNECALVTLSPTKRSWQTAIDSEPVSSVAIYTIAVTQSRH